ncbi:hypothetical protein HYQ46_003601 [Verticillium longisporum]|nr:hypothetical protein HYQ46_003601 [Verticillium longisporum]
MELLGDPGSTTGKSGTGTWFFSRTSSLVSQGIDARGKEKTEEDSQSQSQPELSLILAGTGRGSIDGSSATLCARKTGLSSTQGSGAIDARRNVRGRTNGHVQLGGRVGGLGSKSM